MLEPGLSRWTRRRVLTAGLGGIAVAAAGGLELVDHRVLPGKHLLDQIDGACDVNVPPERFRVQGETLTGRFFSAARHREVGYTIAYPPGHGRGSRLALGLCLHADGGDHTSGLGGLSLAQALAGNGLPPLALVAADGGNLYWHRHPGDDPMAMMIDEVVPMCRRLGLGATPGSIGTIGISMGGYGALLLAERYPRLISAVSAISPAVWTSYGQAKTANPGAYRGPADFTENDVITHVSSLAHTPVRVCSGLEDPFHPGVVALIDALPRASVTEISTGCHDGMFFAGQRHRSIQFLGEHLSTTPNR